VDKKIVHLQPVKFIPDIHKWQWLDPLSAEEMAEVIERADRVGYVCESSIGGSPPFTDRIKVNDPAGEGYHRDYLATIERS